MISGIARYLVQQTEAKKAKSSQTSISLVLNTLWSWTSLMDTYTDLKDATYNQLKIVITLYKLALIVAPMSNPFIYT